MSGRRRAVRRRLELLGKQSVECVGSRTKFRYYEQNIGHSATIQFPNEPLDDVTRAMVDEDNAWLRSFTH